jgi:hypothetical protein
MGPHNVARANKSEHVRYLMHECNASALSSPTPCFPKFWQRIISLTCRQRGAGEGHMDDLIGRRVATAGVDRTAAAKAVGIILQFLSREALSEKVCAPLRHIRGVDATLPATRLCLRSPDIPGAMGPMEVGSQSVFAGPARR